MCGLDRCSSLWFVVYLDEVNSHLLLSLAGSVRCDTGPTLVKHILRCESRVAILPPSSGAAPAITRDERSLLLM